MVRIVDGSGSISPLTQEERRTMGETLERIRARRERMLQERNGRYFPSAAEVIRGLREEQDGEPL